MRSRGMLGVLVLAATLLAMHPTPARAVTRISASIDFYNGLEPYGDWQYVSRYGDCWVPRHRAGWRPYSVGYWVDTDYGWMWISQDPWGDVPYHYGRWAFDVAYGWIWVPDDELVWAPSWCAWRYGDDYVGWAPLPPDADWGGSGLSINVSFIDRNIYRSGWCFTPVRTFGTRSVRYSILPPSRNVTLIARTTNYTRYEARGSMPVARGVPPELLTRATGRRFERYRVADVSSPARLTRPAIRGRTIQVNRATIVGAQRERARFAPRGGNAQNMRQRGNERAQSQDMRQRGNERRQNQDMRQNRGAIQRQDNRDMQRRQNQDAAMRQQRQQDRARYNDQRRQDQQMRRQEQQQDRARYNDQRRQEQQMRRQQSQDRGPSDQQRYERRGRGPDQGNGGSRDQQGRWRREQRPPQDQQPQPQPQQQQRQRGGRDQGQGQAPDQNQRQEDRGKGRGQRDRNQSQDQDQNQQNDRDKNRGHGHGG